jgi:nucleoside-diphosphate-sugar epimerase
MDVELHVVFGAGQVGYPLAERLLAAGKHVRIVKRSAAHVPPGSDVLLGDASDRTFCTNAATGATTVYHCMNPPYSTRVWAEFVPRYLENLIAASAQTGARLVVLDNVYMLGPPRGRTLNEDTPLNPSSRKGEIRARAAERLFEAHRHGEVVATSGRASDFYGPGGTLTALGDFFWPRALSGRTAYSPFPLDAAHTYHYIPDVATGLATLGCADASAYGRPWMLPGAPAGTLRELVTRLAGKLGCAIKVAEVPRWVLKTMAVVVPLMHELDEMLYQWNEPFVIDDSRFRARFQVLPTDVNQAAVETVDWAKRHYGRHTSPAGATAT